MSARLGKPRLSHLRRAYAKLTHHIIVLSPSMYFYNSMHVKRLRDLMAFPPGMHLDVWLEIGPRLNSNHLLYTVLPRQGAVDDTKEEEKSTSSSPSKGKASAPEEDVSQVDRLKATCS